MKTIVAATDFSNEALRAAERAAMIAKEQQAHLMLLHVISGSSWMDLGSLFGSPVEAETKLIDDARRMLHDVAAGIDRKLGVTGSEEIKIEQVLPGILSATDSADLLVMGARGTTPLQDLILGTTAERVLMTGKRPMLVVKCSPLVEYQRVIVPTDFSSHSVSALRVARTIAPHSHLTMLHAFRIPFEGRLRIAGASEDAITHYCEAERQASMKRMTDLIRDSQVQGDDLISVAVERGDPSPAILAKAQSLSADLIVMGKHGQSRLEDLFLGSVTRHVLAGSKCDVLVVPD